MSEFVFHEEPNGSLYSIEEKHIDEVKSGFIIMFQGKPHTVCESNISHCSFMGKSVFGDNYHGGQKKVEVAVPVTWRNKEKYGIE